MVSDVSTEVKSSKQVAEFSARMALRRKFGISGAAAELVTAERVLPLSKVATIEDVLSQSWLADYKIALASEALRIQHDFNKDKAEQNEQRLDELRLACATSEREESFACWEKERIIRSRRVELIAEQKLRHEIRTLEMRSRKLEDIFESLMQPQTREVSDI